MTDLVKFACLDALPFLSIEQSLELSLEILYYPLSRILVRLLSVCSIFSLQLFQLLLICFFRQQPLLVGIVERCQIVVVLFLQLCEFCCMTIFLRGIILLVDFFDLVQDLDFVLQNFLLDFRFLFGFKICDIQFLVEFLYLQIFYFAVILLFCFDFTIKVLFLDLRTFVFIFCSYRIEFLLCFLSSISFCLSPRTFQSLGFLCGSFWDV